MRPDATSELLSGKPKPSLPQQTAALLVRVLRMGGFVSIQTKAIEDGVLVRADALATGLAHTMPIMLRAKV